MGTISTEIDSLIDGVIGREGNYSNHPADRGGPTRWGITEVVARAHGYSGDMRVFPRDRAVEVYRQVYWFAPGFHAVSLRLPLLGSMLFEIGVNMGVSVAGTFLQRVLNVFNQNAAHYPDLVVDGRIGAMSLHALDQLLQRRGAEGQQAIINAVECLWGARYIEISESRPANEAFTYGWFRRMIEWARSHAPGAKR